MQESLRFYLGQITMAQEEERKRIARELHDETIQALVVLARQLDDVISVSSDLSFDKRRLLENLRKQTNDVMADVRRLSQDLRPPALDRLGLVPALEWLASDIGKRSGINVEIRIHGVSRRFPPEVELVLFRVAQEALRNAWRHAQATRADIAVEFGGRKIRITVKDNGKGFDLPETTGDLVKSGRLGLAGMQERIQLVGGSLRIESRLGEGTMVVIEAPA
jgi:signal transduction histidine kinase